MTTGELYERAAAAYRARFGTPHTVAAYAPGRVEVLGNHTDYNEGFVLSAAINMGTCFLAAPAAGSGCQLVAADLREETAFEVTALAPSPAHKWSNYVRGVLSGLQKHGRTPHGFTGLFLGSVPLGSGLSSSAALEVSSGMALGALYGIRPDPLELARIGQAAEHQFVGAKCGLLDQISSLFGKKNALVMSDFRSLQIQTVPLGPDACLIMCNTNVKHSLVDSEYNERRERCESAAAHFAGVLDHPVKALRDVSWEEWQRLSPEMDPVTARRAAHVIGENTRVLRGRELLNHGDLTAFGQLMYESHRSSIEHFENSCPELDFLVKTAARVPGALGARLSGGGFGGSAVILAHPRDAEVVGKALSSAYRKQFGAPCDVRLIVPSDGAAILAPLH